MDTLLTIPSTVSKVTTMANRSLRITFDTRESLSDAEMGRITALHEKYGWLAFLPGQEVAPEDLAGLPALPKREEDDKSPAQRLRACLYVLWEQKGKDGDYEDFYQKQMARFIDAVKEKLT